MGAGRETTLHVVASILRTLRDTRTLPVWSSIMIGKYPLRTTSLTSLLHSGTA